jgi:hypothetical protein
VNQVEQVALILNREKDQLRVENERLRADGQSLIDALDDMHKRGETFTARVSITVARFRDLLKKKV